MSPYASDDDVVDTAAMASCSTPLSDRLSASSHCVLVDWRASVRRTFVDSRIAQDHFRDRPGTCEGAPAGPRRSMDACSRLTACALQVDSSLSHRPPAQSSTARGCCASPIRDRHDRHREAGRLRLVCPRHLCVAIRGRSELWRTTAVTRFNSAGYLRTVDLCAVPVYQRSTTLCHRKFAPVFAPLELSALPQRTISTLAKFH